MACRIRPCRKTTEAAVPAKGAFGRDPEARRYFRGQIDRARGTLDWHRFGAVHTEPISGTASLDNLAPPPRSMPSLPRNHGLDVLRGLTKLLVIVNHPEPRTTPDFVIPVARRDCTVGTSRRSAPLG